MKNKIILFFATFYIINFQSQIYNVINYGVTNNSKNSDKALQSLIIKLKKENSANKVQSTLFFPTGKYIINTPIVLDKYISVKGEDSNLTIIQTIDQNDVFILENNKSENDIYRYNLVENITILGPDYNQNPFGYKDKTKVYNNSTAIRVNGLRTRINNVTIKGFMNAAILVESSYYTYINNCFINSNATGIKIQKTSTSTFVQNSEIRNNSIGIIISNSFGNFIQNNIIESNLGEYLAYDKTKYLANSMGKAIVLDNSKNNNIQNNYIENHYLNFHLKDAENNIISNNFIAITDYTRDQNGKSQILLLMNGKSKNNNFSMNTTLSGKMNIDLNNIELGDQNYSSNIINLGKENNKLIKNKFKNLETKSPTILD